MKERTPDSKSRGLILEQKDDDAQNPRGQCEKPRSNDETEKHNGSLPCSESTVGDHGRIEQEREDENERRYAEYHKQKRRQISKVNHPAAYHALTRQAAPANAPLRILP